MYYDGNKNLIHVSPSLSHQITLSLSLSQVSPSPSFFLFLSPLPPLTFFLSLSRRYCSVLASHSVGAACTRVAAAPTLSLLLREDEAAPAMLLPSPAYSDLSSPTMPMRPEERRAVFTPCV
ncbi:uncharacterized protein DS421_11g321900 [Arachis hypogaea]|nr:uncharacterized protein DS421_11g321900 [Arachis hypogaea]